MKISIHLFVASLYVVSALSCGLNESKAPVTNPSPNASSSVLLFEETFETAKPFATVYDMEVGNWGYALQYVDTPVFRGTRAARFEIREDQPLLENGKRSEVTVIKGEEGGVTKNTWYSFAVYFPSDGYEYDTEREVITQWYQKGSPATSLRTSKDRFILETGNKLDNRKKIDLGPVTKNTWQHFTFHFIHSYDKDGLIEIWQNGKKILTQAGGNMYRDALPKWKIGIYKAAFKHGTSAVDKRVVYFDDIRIGSANATLAHMTATDSTRIAADSTD